MIGSERDATVVLATHGRAAQAGVLRGSSGFFGGCEWARGADRWVWRLPDDSVVYKIEDSPSGTCNEDEDRHMREWSEYEWAPPTELYAITRPAVLAMPYYPGKINSMDEIPPGVYDVRVNDFNISNFRRRDDGQVMLIDAGYP